MAKRLGGLGEGPLLETLIHVRGRAAAPTAAEVATEMGVALTVARSRLERLVAIGLLVPAFRPQPRPGPGSGRPAKAYAVAPEREHIEFPARRLEHLARLLADALPRRGRRRRLCEIGARFGRDLADELDVVPRVPPESFERLASSLREAGYQVAVESASADAAVLVTPTCPLRPLITHDPSHRELDQGMWQGLVEGALTTPRRRGVEAVCETHGCLDEGNCRIVVSLRTR